MLPFQELVSHLYVVTWLQQGEGCGILKLHKVSQRNFSQYWLSAYLENLPPVCALFILSYKHTHKKKRKKGGIYKGRWIGITHEAYILNRKKRKKKKKNQRVIRSPVETSPGMGSLFTQKIYLLVVHSLFFPAALLFHKLYTCTKEKKRKKNK